MSPAAGKEVWFSKPAAATTTVAKLLSRYGQSILVGGRTRELTNSCMPGWYQMALAVPGSHQGPTSTPVHSCHMLGTPASLYLHCNQWCSLHTLKRQHLRLCIREGINTATMKAVFMAPTTHTAAFATGLFIPLLAQMVMPVSDCHAGHLGCKRLFCERSAS